MKTKISQTQAPSSENKRNENEIAHAEAIQEETKPDMNTIAEEPASEEWKAKAEEHLEGWKRTQAEFENYKKRQSASEKELRGYLIERLVLDLIPVLDNFHAATQHVPEAEKKSSWVTGIGHIEKQLESVLRDNGMETIEAQVGEMFDPSLHESLSLETGEPEQSQKQVISRVLQKGYRLGERVVRPAKVIIK